MTDRYDAVRAVAGRAGVDGLALVPGANFTRLFGREFHQSERPLVVVIPAAGQAAAVVPHLEMNSFQQTGFDGRVYPWRDQDGYQAAFDEMLQELSLISLGVEGQVMRVFVEQALRRARPGLQVHDLQKEIAALRLCKDDQEIRLIEKAIGISERALANTIDGVRVGMTEKAIESLLLQSLFAEGADELAFAPIVAAAENSASPHAHARQDYAIRAGDSLLIDFGARSSGLCADITRTFFVGHCSDEHAELYDLVLRANLAGHAAARPGATAHDVDDAATRVLEDSAWASRIIHKTGHGLGRDIHEDPYIMRGNRQVLESGMVFTIEPGLYAAEDIGIRIEDDVLLTDSGSRSLTRFDKRLTVIG